MDKTYKTGHWEVSLQEFMLEKRKMYKVKRQLNNHYLVESKTFTKKEEAIRQFNEWIET